VQAKSNHKTPQDVDTLYDVITEERHSERSEESHGETLHFVQGDSPVVAIKLLKMQISTRPTPTLSVGNSLLKPSYLRKIIAVFGTPLPEAINAISASFTWLIA